MNEKWILAVVMVLVFAGTNPILADLTDGLIAYYPFNGNANDETGNGHDGVVYGATLTTGRFGDLDGAYSFDGINDYIEIMNTADFGFNNQSFSVCLWVQVRDNEPGYESFFHLSNQNDSSRFPIAKGSWGQGSRIYTEFDSGWACQVITDKYGGVLPLNTWMHLVSVVNCETGKLELYADGVPQLTRSRPDLISFDFSSPSPPKLFFVTGPEAHGNYLSGLIDEVCIYDRALTQTEVEILYILEGPVLSPGNMPPVADAGEDVIADANEEVTLDASASNDPDGEIVRYVWTALPEDAVLYSGTESSFTTKALGRVEEVIKLTVTGDRGRSSEDTVSILNGRVEEISQLQAQVSALQQQVQLLEQQNAQLQQMVDENRYLLEQLPQLSKKLDELMAKVEETP